MKKKIALIFGITGQDGSYLAELLLNKNYVVYGVKRRTSLINTSRIDHIYKDFHLKTNLILKYGDVTDFSNIFNLIKAVIQIGGLCKTFCRASKQEVIFRTGSSTCGSHPAM